MVEAPEMTIVEEDLEDKGTEDSLLMRRMMMPMIPYSILLKESMETISKIYWTGDDLEEVIEKNESKYLVTFSRDTGRYEFANCNFCKGPILGHKQKNCDNMTWKDEEIEIIENMIIDSKAFDAKFGIMELRELRAKQKEDEKMIKKVLAAVSNMDDQYKEIIDRYKEELKKYDNLREKCEEMERERNLKSSESIEIEKENNSLKHLVRQKEDEIELLTKEKESMCSDSEAYEKENESLKNLVEEKGIEIESLTRQ